MKSIQTKNLQYIDNIADYYEILQELGEGNFGEVKLAKHLRSGVLCAIKVVNKRYLREKD